MPTIFTGTQKRTIKCGCGKIISGNPKRLDTIFKLHKKVCPYGDAFGGSPMPSSVEFDNNTINTSANGISINKRGSASVCKEAVGVAYGEATPLCKVTVKKAGGEISLK